jgi:endo-1,4-beta-xylanase
MKKISVTIMSMILLAALISSSFVVSAEAIQYGEAKSVTATFPVIDGVMDDIWAEANTYVLETAKAGTSDGGMRASFKLLWSPTTLYGILVVPDTTPNHDADNNYQRDCAEIGFDFSNSRETSYINDDQFHWTVRTNGDGLELKGGIPGSDFMVEGDTFTWAMTEDASGYIIEWAIHCDKLGITLSADKMIGFEAQINDNAEGERNRNHCYSWNDTADASYNNPDHFGEIKLVATSVEPEPVAETPAEVPAEASVPAPAQTAAEPAPRTADPITLFALGSIVSAAGIYIARKRK